MDKVNFSPFAEILAEDFLRQSGYIEDAFKWLIYDFLHDTVSVTGLEVTAQAIPDMSVYVKPGRIYEHGKQGRLVNNLSPPLTIAAAHPQYERIDRVCACWRETPDTPETRNVMIDTVSRQITQSTVMTRIAATVDFMMVNGIASPTPAAPTAPDGWVSLAQVKVRANTAIILPSDVLDERPTITSLISHVRNKNNPHGVTGEQMGLDRLIVLSSTVPENPAPNSLWIKNLGEASNPPTLSSQGGEGVVIANAVFSHTEPADKSLIWFETEK